MKKIWIILVGISLTIGTSLFSQGALLKETNWKKKTIELRTNVKLEYAEQGDADEIPVILLHGIGDSWHSFEKVLQYLPVSLHVFAITQRGHGNSSKPDTGYRPNDFAGDVAAFMKEKRIAKAVIAGHSMGGVNALQFSLAYPHLVAGVVLIDSDPAFSNNPGFPEFYQDLLKMSGNFDRNFMNDFQQSTLARPIDTAYFRFLVDEALKVPVPVFRQAFKGFLDVDFSVQLKNIGVPLLAFWGGKDTFCNRSDQEEFLKNCKNAKLVVYENTGHALHWEEPERFAGDLADFISKSVK